LKFILDVNLPPSLCQRLARHSHEAFHAGKLGLWKATDETVLSLAESQGAVLLTHDLGFGKLLAFSQKEKPSVVIFRLEKLNSEILEGILLKDWGLIERPVLLGAIVVIEENDVRIRRLPIGGTGLEGLPEVHEAPAVYKAGPSRKTKAGRSKPKQKKRK
jgi:predicted nuclease of predicted toxin-antitoxin system